VKLYDWFEWRLRWFSHLVSYVSDGSPDYSVREGDWISHPGWKYGPVKVISLNWAINAGAFQLGDKGGIVVLDLGGIKKND